MTNGLRRAKIGESNSTDPVIRGPDLFRHLFSTLSFRSLSEIEYESKKATSVWRHAIRRESGQIRSGKLSARQNIAQAQIHLAQIPQARAWAIREWRREMARLNRLWRSSGFDAARSRRRAALAEKINAVRVVVKAKPRTVEGCVALPKFVADSTVLSIWER